MRLAVTALLLLASPLITSAVDRKPEPPASGRAQLSKGEKRPCRIKVGPRDRVVQDEDLIVPAGADLDSVVAVRGSVVVQRGAKVQKAVAAGGSVRVEGGARVSEEAVSISGDVRVERGGRVDGDAVSLGGRVRIDEGGEVRGHVTSLSLQLGAIDLERELREKLLAEGKCVVEAE